MLKIRKFVILTTMAAALFGLTACSTKGNQSSSGTQNITKAGTYEFTGDIDGSIVVDAGKEDEITLVLNGVNLKSDEDDAAIKILKAKKVTITLEDGTQNTIEDSAKRNTSQTSDSENSETDFDAAIYSKTDLYLNGTGELVVTGNYGDGIAGKDSVYIEEGTYKVQAVKHGIMGKDYLEIQGGNFEINCEQDSFHSNGDFVIQKGSFLVDCGDDAFHAEKALKIEDGTIDITACNEGLEGETVTITGGEISIVSSDDGINAASSEETTNAGNQRENPFEVNGNNAIQIDGGNIYINAGGDGIDSNGNVVVTGGTIKIDGSENGGNGALDYGGIFEVSGGSVIAVGASGMALGISDTSSVYGIMMTCDTQISANTPIILEDEQGEVLQYTPAKKYNSVVIADAGLEQGKSYTLKIGDNISVTFTISNTMTYLNQNGVTEGQNGMNGEWGKGGKRDDFDKTQIPGNMTQEELPEDMVIPEGMEMPEGMVKPDGTQKPENMELPQGMEMPEGTNKQGNTQQSESTQENP